MSRVLIFLFVSSLVAAALTPQAHAGAAATPPPGSAAPARGPANASSATSAAANPAGRAAAPAAVPTQIVDYKLRPEDKLILDFEQAGEFLNRNQRVAQDDTIDLAWIGPVKVGGLTKSEAQRKIEEQYRLAQMVRAARVTIYIEEYAPMYASIPDNVKNPGRILLSPERPSNLVDVILRAGGFAELGNGSKVTVYRKGVELGTYNVSDMMAGKDRSPPPIIEPEDIINIPVRFF